MVVAGWIPACGVAPGPDTAHLAARTRQTLPSINWGGTGGAAPSDFIAQTGCDDTTMWAEMRRSDARYD